MSVYIPAPLAHWQPIRGRKVGGTSESYTLAISTKVDGQNTRQFNIETFSSRHLNVNVIGWNFLDDRRLLLLKVKSLVLHCVPLGKLHLFEVMDNNFRSSIESVMTKIINLCNDLMLNRSSSTNSSTFQVTFFKFKHFLILTLNSSKFQVRTIPERWNVTFNINIIKCKPIVMTLITRVTLHKKESNGR